MGFILTESPLGSDRRSIPHVYPISLPSRISQDTPVVFVIDSDSAIRKSLELLIRREGWRPETFASAEDFLRRPLELVPSCLLLDVSLPGLSGLELQERIAGERRDIPIIFLCANFDVPTAVKAMKAGAAEFFTKPFKSQELLKAIREAHERSRLALVQEAERQFLKGCYSSLSPRERQVMTLVSQGLLNKQIGSELGISEITVKAHRGQVMQKMQAKSVADLVRMASRLSLGKRLEMAVSRNPAPHWRAELPTF